MGKARGLLALVRASIALSAAADGVAGLALAVAAGADPPTPTLVLIPLISLLLFAFGMAQNDLADRAKDAAGRGRDRPIPSGAVTLPTARALVLVCGVTAFLLAWFVGPRTPWQVASLLASISLYNLGPQHLGRLGPSLLGLIRAQNLALAGVTLGETRAIVPAAVLYFLYITAVSVAARMEDGEVAPSATRLGVAVRAAQLVALIAPTAQIGHGAWQHALAGLLVSGWLVTRIEAALRAALASGLSSPPAIPRLIGACLSGIFLFDASLALAAGQTIAGAGLLLLFPVSRMLVRRFPPS